METKKEELVFHLSPLKKALSTLDEVLEHPFSRLSGMQQYNGLNIVLNCHGKC